MANALIKAYYETDTFACRSLDDFGWLTLTLFTLVDALVVLKRWLSSDIDASSDTGVIGPTVRSLRSSNCKWKITRLFIIIEAVTYEIINVLDIYN